MKSRHVVVLALVLLDCDPVIRREEADKVVKVETVRCDTVGICCKYGWDFSRGDIRYWCGVHLDCPGTQQSKVLHSTEVTTFQSGRVYRSETSRVIENTTVCKR